MKEVEQREFECHFSFDTIVQTHGRNEEGATENIDRMIHQEIVYGAERIMGCGIDYDRDNVETKEIENGWFELTLHWSGSWSIDADTEEEAKKIAEEFLDERLTPFYQMIEIEADKRSRFEFHELKNEKVIDIIEW